MDRQFTQEDYDVALAHECARLHDAAVVAGFTPRRMPSIQYIGKKPNRLTGYWYLSMPVCEHLVDGDDHGSLDVSATAPTLGALFEAAHVKLRQNKREAA